MDVYSIQQTDTDPNMRPLIERFLYRSRLRRSELEEGHTIAANPATNITANGLTGDVLMPISGNTSAGTQSNATITNINRIILFILGEPQRFSKIPMMLHLIAQQELLCAVLTTHQGAMQGLWEIGE